MKPWFDTHREHHDKIVSGLKEKYSLDDDAFSKHTHDDPYLSIHGNYIHLACGNFVTMKITQVCV